MLYCTMGEGMAEGVSLEHTLPLTGCLTAAFQHTTKEHKQVHGDMFTHHFLFTHHFILHPAMITVQDLLCGETRVENFER